MKRNKLKEALQDMETSPKLIKLVMMTIKKSKAKVKVDNKMSEAFEITKGVIQGDRLSTTLFTIALHKAIKDIGERGIIFNKSRQICTYVDDIGIFARTKSRLIEIYKKVEELGLIINVDKTKYMLMSAAEQRKEQKDLEVDGVIFKAVIKFKYLGDL